MKKALLAGASALALAGAAEAGGIDRSGQPIDILFGEYDTKDPSKKYKFDNRVELGFAMTTPSVGGDELPLESPFFPGGVYDSGASYDNVAGAFPAYIFGLRYRINEKFSLAVIGAEDFGSDITYKKVNAGPFGSLLGGTEAIADSYSLSVIGRYEFNPGDKYQFSAHAGIRGDWAKGNIRLEGLAYGANSTYEVELGSDFAVGWLVGAAFEIPEYALRFDVTYFSEIEHNFDTDETHDTLAGLAGSGKTKVTTPQAVNVNFQTGVYENTEGPVTGALVFGSFRWADWSEFKIAPENFATFEAAPSMALPTGRTAQPDGLVALDDAYVFEIGVMAQFLDNWSGSLSYIYEPERDDDLVSPLSPTNGRQGIAIGARYTMDQWDIAAGFNYFWLGDAKPETGTPDVARADFTDNTFYTVGIRVGYNF